MTIWILTCHPQKGFKKKGGKCVPECDENQCSRNGACPDFSTCTDKCKGYSCTCIEGYTKEKDQSGKTVCVPECDANQCEQNTPYSAKCPYNSKCENLCQVIFQKIKLTIFNS